MKKILIGVFSLFYLLLSVMPFSAIPFAKGAEKAKKLVLIELFTAEWCGPCVDANRKLDKWYEETFGKEFVFIKEHIGDALSNTYTEKRSGKYDVRSVPSSFMNGESFDIRNESDAQSRMRKHLAIKTDATIQLEGKVVDSKVVVTATYENVPADSELNIVLTEDFTYFVGSNGEKFHRFLVRDGKTIETKENASERVEFNIKPEWAKEFLNCIVFIESKNTILNAQIHNLDNPRMSNTKDLVSVVPNEVIYPSIKVNDSLKSVIKLTNAGKMAGKVTISTKDSFIELSETSFTVNPLSQQEIPFHINPASLSAGNYSGKMEVKTSSYTKVIPVVFSILPKPKLSISTNSLDFGTMSQGTKDTRTVAIKNTEIGPISVVLQSKAKWIQFSKRNFESNAETITVTCNTKGLESGEYEDEIKITSNGGNDTIQVHVTVVAPKVIAQPDSLDFGKYILGGDLPAPQAFLLKNEGQEDADIEVMQTPDFITLDCKKEFSLKIGQEQNITLSLVADKLTKVGTYTDKVTFTFKSSKIELEVTVVVEEAPPTLQVQYNDQNVEKIALEMKLGEKKEVELVSRNIGSGKLDATVSIRPATPGITLSTSKYSLLANGKKTISVKIDTATMEDGTFSFDLQIKSNGGDREIPFEITVVREKIMIELRIGSKKATISGKEVPMDAAPYLKKGSTLVPLRFIGEAFGAKIDWQPKVGKGTINITLCTNNIMIEIGNSTALVNGAKVTLTVPPEITTGRTFVPLRFISEAFGAEVQWIAETQTIKISY